MRLKIRGKITEVVDEDNPKIIVELRKKQLEGRFVESVPDGKGLGYCAAPKDINELVGKEVIIKFDKHDPELK